MPDLLALITLSGAIVNDNGFRCIPANNKQGHVKAE